MAQLLFPELEHQMPTETPAAYCMTTETSCAVHIWGKAGKGLTPEPLGCALPRPGCYITVIRVILLGKHIKQIVSPDCRPCLGKSNPGLKMC